MKRKIFSESIGGNRRWTIYATENKNENILEIHNNSMGKQEYRNEHIYDIDVFKLMRLLDDLKYSGIKMDKLVKKVNSNCRHLKMTYIACNTGSLLY